MSQKKVASIVDVAVRAGVSPATVSRYINKPDIVGAATRKRIEQAIEQLGYVRNRLAGSLHGQRTDAIGLVVPTIDNAIFSEMIEAFSTRLMHHNYTMLIASHGYDAQLEGRLVRTLLERRVDGVVMVGLDHLDETLTPLTERDIPFMTLWAYDENSPYPCIGIDNEVAGWLVTRYLLDLGHRDIALIFAEIEMNDRARARRNGAVRALTEAGIVTPPDWVIQSEYDIGEAKQTARRLLSGTHRPTAIVSGNDIIAQGVIYAAHSLNRSVPDDVSVVGIGDFPSSAQIEPALTTVRIPARRIGRTAADTILALIQEPGSLPRIHVEPELKVRASARHPK